MEKFLDRRYGASWIDSPKRIRRLLYANRHHSRKAGLVRRVIPAAPHASALPACGALRVIFNSLKVPLSTSVLSHDGALLDGVVLFRGMLSRTSRNSERSLCHIAKRTVVSSLT